MSIDLEGVRAVAEQTRADFEQGAVLEDEIVESALVTDRMHIFAARLASPSMEAYERGVADGTLRKVGRYFLPVPLVSPDRKFPHDACEMASSVLAARLIGAKVLGDKKPEIAEGGWGVDSYTSDGNYTFSNPHTFINLGFVHLAPTAKACETILDITADQFDPNIPPVYLGPLKDPWTTAPLFEGDVW
ncbi:hypothetical protein EYC59_05110 [Candidatus Saccharibacteria bacterium]|nr:MAG: hypothetical protein EYC59_05110 [Candidatus Saccharibacteria bacterium]